MLGLQEFVTKVDNHITKLNTYAFRRYPPVIPACIPHSLGFTPELTARAYVGLERQAFNEMVDEARRLGLLPETYDVGITDPEEWQRKERERRQQYRKGGAKESG